MPMTERWNDKKIDYKGDKSAIPTWLMSVALKDKDAVALKDF